MVTVGKHTVGNRGFSGRISARATRPQRRSRSRFDRKALLLEITVAISGEIAGVTLKRPVVLLPAVDAEADRFLAGVAGNRLVEEVGPQQQWIGDLDGAGTDTALARPEERRIAQALETAAERDLDVAFADLAVSHADGCHARAAGPIDAHRRNRFRQAGAEQQRLARSGEDICSDHADPGIDGLHIRRIDPAPVNGFRHCNRTEPDGAMLLERSSEPAERRSCH